MTRELSERSRVRAQRIEYVQRVGARLKMDLEPAVIASRVADAAREALGFRGAVLNLVDRPGEQGARARVVAASGLPPEGVDALMANDYPVADIDLLFRPEFRISRSYFIPAGHLDLPDGTEITSWTNENISNEGPDAWDTGDELLVPLMDADDSPQLIGFLSVDEPESGRRPDLEEVEVLEIFADQAVVALRNAALLAEARHLAERDSVTGLFNHRAGHMQFELEFANAMADGRELSLISLDLDNFKLINDTHGHHVGDMALRHVAAVLRRGTRDKDSIARVGGDEFLVILPTTGSEGAAVVAERLIQLSHESPFSVDAVGLLPLRLSAGVATYPGDAAQQHGLLTLADSRLYEAKRSSGRSIVAATNSRQHENRLGPPGFDVLNALVTAVGNKDRYTCEHSDQVATFACMLASEIGLSSGTQDTLRLAGLLHDVGKIGVPDEILRKPGPLDKYEWQVMRRHVDLSITLVSSVLSDRDVLDAVACHHERWDGEGYPNRLAGSLIPILGRIMIVADAVSAMLCDRPYRTGLEEAEIIVALREGAGSQFDPDLVEPFVTAFTTGMTARAA